MFVTVTLAEIREGMVQEAEQAIAELASEFLRLPGFQGVEHLRSTDNENLRLFLLRWENRAAWEAYREGYYRQRVKPDFIEPYMGRFELIGTFQLVEM